MSNTSNEIKYITYFGGFAAPLIGVSFILGHDVIFLVAEAAEKEINSLEAVPV
jgi:hypothetical protein